eukprot:TRINITY_DN7385_c0_g1_i1.p1 TRINITY_DN7385_c0_g1~~TRINITY_DN7385_c0_g1_i1.p1  ORF type:complete len:543 (-),score=108.62 TRINITY_DN7385_c0_g1_i1:130-1758(-)
MVWGHAVSKDLVHWTHLPVAISTTPGSYDKDGVWTGSMTINTPFGFPSVIYTGVSPEVQCMVYPSNISDPFLTNWTKLNQNPIIPSRPDGFTSGFRDPTTAWYDEVDQSYNLIVGSGNSAGGATLLFTSQDFISWKFLHPLLSTTSTAEWGTMWECPDFFKISLSLDHFMKNDRLTDQQYQRKKPNGDQEVFHVMKTSAHSIGYGDHYLVGKYDPLSKTFQPSTHGIVDYGSNYYASKSFYDEAKDRQIIWGWVTEGDQSAGKRGWAGMSSLPREINLHEVTCSMSNGSRSSTNMLSFHPVEELQSLRQNYTSYADLQLNNQSYKLNVTGSSMEVSLSLTANIFNTNLDTSQGFGINVRKSAFEQTSIYITLPRVQIGFDLPGNTYKTIPLGNGQSYLTCQDLCYVDTACQAWTYDLTSCQLKSPLPNPVPSSVKTSGVRPLLIVDRSKSSLAPDAARSIERGTLTSVCPIGKSKVPRVDKLDMRVFLDESVVEIYVNGGTTAVTTRIYPTKMESIGLELFASGLAASFDSVEVWKLLATNP